MSWAYNPNNNDKAPICGSIYNVATLAPPPVAPWQGEVVCITSSPVWTDGSPVNTLQKQWRFTHEFNTGGSSDFDVQFAISELSGDGHWLAFSSDWNCTLSTTDGGASPLYCGPPWVGGTTYTVGQMINPFSTTGGSGTNYGVYQISSCGGTCMPVSSTKPSWFVCNSGTSGNTVTDLNGTTVYKCLGKGNGKGEVFVVQLEPY